MFRFVSLEDLRVVEQRQGSVQPPHAATALTQVSSKCPFLLSYIQKLALPASSAKTLNAYFSFGLVTPAFLRRNCILHFKSCLHSSFLRDC